MVNQDSLPEHVRDSKLSTSFQSGLTIHTKPSCRRNAQPKETWCQEKVLGHGGNGVVLLQRRTSQDGMAPELRAVKQIWVPHDSHSSAKSYLRELEALSKFSQYKYTDFFVQSYGWYSDSLYLYIAMEYCEHGDLRVYLKSTGILPENQAQDIAAQVLGGLSIMHQAGFAHRDIKPANILIKSKPPDDWWVKVSDFGLSKRTELIAGSTTVRGTPGFMPPETVGLHPDQGTTNPPAADMWCFGETVFQMLTGKGTFGNLMELVDYYNGNNRFPTTAMDKASASEGAVDFVQSLMAAIPSERLTAAQAQNHPWMAPSLEQFKTLSESTRLSESMPFELNQSQNITPPYLVEDNMTEASAAWSTTTYKMVSGVGTFKESQANGPALISRPDDDHAGLPSNSLMIPKRSGHAPLEISSEAVKLAISKQDVQDKATKPRYLLDHDSIEEFPGVFQAQTNKVDFSGPNSIQEASGLNSIQEAPRRFVTRPVGAYFPGPDSRSQPSKGTRASINETHYPGSDSDDKLPPVPEEIARFVLPESLSVKLKVHEDRDRNVTLRRLTEEEAARARGRREPESTIDSPTVKMHNHRDRNATFRWLTEGGAAMARDRREPESSIDSPTVKMHDDRDRNVTLRRLTEEEAAKARGRRDSGYERSSGGIFALGPTRRAPVE